MTQNMHYDDLADVQPGPHTSVSNRSTETAPIVPERRAASLGSAENREETSSDVEALASERPQMPKGQLLFPPEVELPDIATASYGIPASMKEVVRGPDGRVAVKDTTAYPWRGHASLIITARDNSVWSGTGWFSGQGTVITAGHAVYIKGSGVPGRDGWVKSVDVLAGRNGQNLPFGSVRSASFRTTLGWTTEGSEFYDYGAVNVPTGLGKIVGWLGYACCSNAELEGSMLNIVGYPGGRGGTQWYDTRRLSGMETRKIYYDLPIYGGQSGSAVYKIVNGERVVVGIHSHGGAMTDSATRIAMPVFKNIQSWTW